MLSVPKKGERYRDSEWNFVEILGIGRNADNLEELVIFFLVEIPDRFWVLPIKDFIKRYSLTGDSANQTFHEDRKQRDPGDMAKSNQNEKTGIESQKGDERDSDCSGDELAELKTDSSKEISAGGGFLMEFLDASSVDQRLDILKRMKVQELNDQLIDTMAVSLDTEIPKGPIENRYADLMNHLETRRKYEQHRRYR